MEKSRFDRLLKRKLLTSRDLEEIAAEAEASGKRPEELLLAKGVPKHEVLFSLSEHYHLPFAEFDEGLIVSRALFGKFDPEKLKQALWLPLSVTGTRAEVVACCPTDPGVISDVKSSLGVQEIDFLVALPRDLVRIIENNQDINPGFPSSAGRTPLAMTRTFLAERRSRFACDRTAFARGRTGLAFLRTGISFMTIAVVLVRVFGLGYLGIIEGLFTAAGAAMAIDGLLWYVPARKAAKRTPACPAAESACGSTVLEVRNPGSDPEFARTKPIPGAETLRSNWSNLSPVMRRRFLAVDRTDLAEERTALACLRTRMAHARTGLSFTRTGITFIGFGIALLRQFSDGLWVVFDISLIFAGALMAAEGFSWYVPGRQAGQEGRRLIRSKEDGASIWEWVLPPHEKKVGAAMASVCNLPLRPSQSPGIWATTGLALERTVLADRRNVMARLRTVMARSRTGMSFIRTGMSISAVGAGLLVYFGFGGAVWTTVEAITFLAGLAVIADGLYWYLPAEKTKKQFPYCFGEMEIVVPDYGKSCRSWRKAAFSHDDI